MKTCLNISKKLLAGISAVFFIAISFSSCLKENKSTYTPPVALVTFIQASPDEPVMDFYLDNNMIPAGSINYGSNIDYFQAYTGKRTVYFYNTGTKTKIFSDTVTFNQNFAYSLFLANKPSSPELVVLTDSISRPDAGNASIRFINLSPDAPAVDLVVKGGSILVANKAYKGHSSFLPIPGDKIYTLEVHRAGTATVLATIPSLKLNSGFVYTVWFHGLATPANNNDGLAADVLTNAYYY
ncbi:MAG: hypothetical protein JWQ84_2269 [Mucilaginibacter sp.]|nr:hypothetical protein [Mucilaginibacter sp.]